MRYKSNIIYIDLLHLFLLRKVEIGSSLLFRVAFRVRVRAFAFSLLVALDELDSTGASRTISVFVDFQVLRDFSLSLELTDFVREVLEDDIALFVLEFSEAAHDEIAHADPDFLFHLSADVPDTVDLIEAFHQHSGVAQHLDGQAVFESLIILLGKEVSLDWAGVLSSLVALTTSSFVLRHPC